MQFYLNLKINFFFFISIKFKCFNIIYKRFLNYSKKQIRFILKTIFKILIILLKNA